MSAGESSLPDNKGNDADMNEDHTSLSNTDISPQRVGEVLAQENHEVASEVNSLPVGSPADDESNDIGAVAPSSPPGAQSLSAMSTGVENGQRVGFVHDGVDNLHGLSIARNPEAPIANDEHHENSEHHESDISDTKAERVNPFNSSGMHTRQKITHHQQEMMPKFLSLDTFGQDEVPASFLEPDIGRLQLGENLEGSVDEITSNLNSSPKFEASVNTGAFRHLTPNHNGPDHDIIPPTVPPPPSDPWVKVSPESPSKAEEPLPEISPKKEQTVTPQKEVNDTQKPPGLCLDGELKKAPAIEPNASLNPMVLDIPGPCEPEDLIEGVIFSANYLGTTQLVSNRNPAKNARMFQAQEAVNRIKAPDGESQPTVEVDLFISTSKIKILNADTQETMMSHTLRSISYIADIGDLLVVMAKRLPSAEEETPEEGDVMRKDQPKRHRIICHVLSSSDSHLIAESIGQCFNVAYQQFLQSNCIEPQNLTQADFNQLLDTQEMYHDDLVHYSKQENVKEIWVEKKKGETMGIAIVESGWGSIIPTVILANLQHGSPIERNGKFSIGDQIMAINSTSMVGLPLQTCHSIIRGLRNQTLVKINIVSCPPVVSVLIKRPNLKHQLGFSVQNGIICSLMRGGIAERGGVRVGHRIIEINNQSVVATPHDKIVQMLVTSVGEIQMKTMPAAMYRLLTGQEQPIYL